MIVNGPIARELGFNSRDGVFGNGYRANAAVGRAVRLALWNLGGAVPWDTDKATLSHPGEYAFCIAEEEADNPWPPLHVERGCRPGSDAVTVLNPLNAEEFVDNPTTRIPVSAEPDDIHIVAAGAATSRRCCPAGAASGASRSPARSGGPEPWRA